MSTVDVIDAKGKKSGSVDLPAEIFDVTVNVPLMHQVVVRAASGGTPGARTRRRRAARSAAVGRKPYRQKGTGRARQGSTRAPQFTGGGVVHGPPPATTRSARPRR
jgi:large subunit ribosomal protein L4